MGKVRRYKEPYREERADLGLHRWHLRKLVQVGGSYAVILPRHLLKADKRASAGQRRWEKGDQVEIALSSMGEFLVRYVQLQSKEYGRLQAEDMPEEVYGYAPAKKKRMRTVLKETKYDGKKKVYVYDDD